MYFESRGQAGKLLADQLFNAYRYENTAVVALSVGGVLVAEQIAASLHCVMMLIVSKDIDVPGEGTVFGSVSQSGDFTYNGEFSDGEIDGYMSEFHGYLDEQKREAFQTINRTLGARGTIDTTMLQDRVVIVVDDGLDNSARIEVAIEFLKPVRMQRMVVVSPIATVAAVDKVHILADEIHILDVKENYVSTDHYYENNILPTPEDTVKRINEIITKWR